MPHSSHVPRRDGQRGFTLAEILVTTAIFAIIMIAALAVYDRSNRTFKTSTEAADMQQSTRIGFEKLVSDVRMAGYDYSRGGAPINPWEAPQPDEQIEYAGASAIVFRSNFNYNSATGTCAPPSSTAQPCGNGLEPEITPVNVNNQAIFPYVTTSNSEIVAYVLHSATSNPSQIQFYVDDYQPRAAFPSTMTPAPAGSNPSRKEALVTITGIDTTNANPPYTLYRVTLADGNCNGPCTINVGTVGTPVAENVRSLNFQYYTDTNGTTFLKDSAGNSIPSGCTTNCTGAIGGDGQYDPNAANLAGAGTFADRGQRATIQAVRVNLVGMNATPDLQGYTNPTETIGAIKKYREYGLSSLIVPRNLGKTGFVEITSDVPPPPQITGICIGACGAPVLTWKAPSGGAAVLAYQIQWDTDPNFSNPKSQMVNDASATSAVVADDGTFDVSQTWNYRIFSLNANGQSVASNSISAKPQNTTQPSPPTSLIATDLSLNNAQQGQVSLTWTGPMTNQAPKNTYSCAGTGGSTDASAITSGEIIKYRVWRGTRPDFDPRAGCTGPQCGGVAVLRTSTASQPPAVPPGSSVTWTDSATTEQANSGSAPAACTQYYYRVQAVDRCVLNSAYEVSGSTTDSESTYYPPVDGSPNAVKGSVANPGTTPAAPVGLQVNTTNNASGCPDPQLGGPNCRITLLFPAVSADTSGNAIGVDTYRITRKVKHQNNVPSSSYQLDTTFGTGGSGMLDVSGFSQMPPDPVTGKLTWIDTSAPATDPKPPFLGSAFSYEYTVAAKTCSTYSAESNPADFPTPCTINPTIIEADAQGGGQSKSTADTPATAWVMNGGDTITVQPPAGVTFQDVKFDIAAWPSGAPLSSTDVKTSPYVLTWSDTGAAPGQIYQITITVTEATPNAGCQEIHIKYAQEQPPAPCAMACLYLCPSTPALPTPSTTSPGCVSCLKTSGSTTTDTLALALTNNGTDKVTFNISSGAGSPFTGSITESWFIPTGFSDLTAVSFAYSYGTLSTDGYSLGSSPFTRAIPTGVGPITAGTTLQLAVAWSYKKTDGTLTSTPLQKLCIAYRIPSEPNTTKFCNVVGQAVNTKNPNACD